jgi:hypothetical protein
MHITPALHYELGYGTVRGLLIRDRRDRPIPKPSAPPMASEFHCEVDLFDAEKDPISLRRRIVCYGALLRAD